MKIEGGGSSRIADDLRSIFEAAIRAVDAESLVRSRFARLVPDEEAFFRVPSGGKLVVVGAGKAAGAMARGVEAVLGERIDGGFVVVKDGHEEPLDRLESAVAAHPVPDERSERAAERVASLLAGLGPDDRVLVLLTGGASSLLAAPAVGVSLRSKREVTDAMLRAGATIDELNLVRKHLSRLKGGRLARAASPARVLAWVISDVVGDDLGTIASGPTVPDTSPPESALGVLERRLGPSGFPADVRAFLESGGDPVIPGQVPGGDSCATYLLGSNETALTAAVAEARRLGFETRVVSRRLVGEAAEAGRAIAREALDRKEPTDTPRISFWGGETPVTVRGDGRGGRCTELVLSAAIELDGAPGRHVAAIATDGTDGPTDAAGAMADPTTLGRARACGLEPSDCLTRNDSLGFFERIGDSLATGPTRTNVMDLVALVVAGTVAGGAERD